MITLKQWYIIYTASQSKNKVISAFSRKKIEHYSPPLVKDSIKSVSSHVVNAPSLFSSFIFICIAETDMPVIKKIDGVVNFVYWLDKPAIVNSEEIDTIRQFLHDYHDVTLEKSTVKTSEQVSIIDSPLMSREGKVLEVMNNSVKVSLPSIGYILTANVRRTQGEKTPHVSFTKKKFGKFLQF